ncbi:hypothetical protein JOC48_000613 [Aquibacillus albus]|uniref:Uncharacterized protein n=1 Tax=Aquibacillus albus TaxID=1168171 RepID=A0ABS2MWQ8_9BACI|nr:hypothetical protein [Aquibacillus albus]
MAPDEKVLSFEYREGYVHTSVTVLDGHAMLVLQF